MQLEKRLSYVPYVYTVIICFFILLPFGSYIFYKYYSIYTNNIISIINDAEMLLDWSVKNERLMLNNYLSSMEHKAREDFHKAMSLNMDNFIELSDEFLQNKNNSEIKTYIESVSLKYPIYLKSNNGKILAVSKGVEMPTLDNHFEPDTGLPFTITDSKSDDWQILEKEIKGGVFRLGTFLKKEGIENSIRQSIIDFVLTNKNPFFEIFIIDNKGKFLANESGIFPGRALSGKEQQTMIENVLRSILDSKQNPEGKIIEFLWEVPETKPVIVQRKKIFAEYNEASVVSSRLTFSMGLATIFPNNDSLPKSIIKNADDALYKAKKEGRDRIFLDKSLC